MIRKLSLLATGWATAAIVALAACGLPELAHAAPQMTICDSAGHCATVASGSLNVNITGGGGGGGAITAASGSYATGWDADCTITPTIYSACYWLQQINSNVQGSIPSGTNPIGSITNTSFATSAVTTGGATPFHLASSAASNNATLVSTGAHTLYALVVTGTNTAVGDVRIYDTSGSPTCSSATGVLLNIPVITTTGLQGGLIVPIPAQGMVLANGLAYCVTGAVADNDNTNAPTGVNVNGLYK